MVLIKVSDVDLVLELFIKELSVWALNFLKIFVFLVFQTFLALEEALSNTRPLNESYLLEPNPTDWFALMSSSSRGESSKRQK